MQLIWEIVDTGWEMVALILLIIVVPLMCSERGADPYNEDLREQHDIFN